MSVALSLVLGTSSATPPPNWWNTQSGPLGTTASVVCSPGFSRDLGPAPCLGPCPQPGGRGLKQLLSLPQDKGDVGVKELDSLKSDRLRTVQLNVCKSEEVEKVVEIVRTSLEDPEKGMGHLGAARCCTGALSKHHPLFAGILPKTAFFSVRTPAQ